MKHWFGKLCRRLCRCRRIVLVGVTKGRPTTGNGPAGLVILRPGSRLRHVRLVDVDLQIEDWPDA